MIRGWVGTPLFVSFFHSWESGIDLKKSARWAVSMYWTEIFIFVKVIIDKSKIIMILFLPRFKRPSFWHNPLLYRNGFFHDVESLKKIVIPIKTFFRTSLIMTNQNIKLNKKWSVKPIWFHWHLVYIQNLPRLGVWRYLNLEQTLRFCKKARVSKIRFGVQISIKIFGWTASIYTTMHYKNDKHNSKLLSHSTHKEIITVIFFFPISVQHCTHNLDCMKCILHTYRYCSLKHSTLFCCLTTQS